MELLQVVDRKNEIRSMAQPAGMVKQRIAQAAQDLNRAGSLALHVEIANEAITRFTFMLYHRDQDNGWANIDGRTYRIFPPAPWGSGGWRKWGLRNWESRIFSAVMLERVRDSRRPCLFDYNTTTKKWYLNVADYPAIEAAQHYLQRSPITLAEWRKHDNIRRQAKNALATD